jgi:xylulokinase
MQYVLGIDLGTSSTKTVLFDAQGRQVCEASQEYPLYQPQNGWAEQEPEDWFQAAVTTIRKVLDKSGVPGDQIAGIGLSGQMHGLVMLDEEGLVLRRCIIWADQRTAAECEEITRRVGYDRLIEETCNPALPGFTAGKILWVQRHEPELFKRCRHILLPKDYLRYRLTGEMATEVSDASGMQLLNVPGRKWSQVMLDALDLREDMLGKVYESPEITGRVTESTAQATGLAQGTPVVGGAGDNAAAAIGTGVVRDGRAFTTIGTSGVVFAHTDQIAIDPKGRVHTFCCAVPGAWHMMGVTQAAGLSLQWFRNNFYPEDKDYVQINTDAAATPIGANRLIFLPYLMGERTPHLDADCRGGFVGLSAIHTKKDMARAVMEGVSYSLRDCLGVLNEMGVHPDNMVLSGGGAKSPLWQQMLTDVFHCNTCLSSKENSAALGAAILAAVGAGLYSSVPEAADTILQYTREAKPDQAHAQKYSQVYQVYRMMYPGLRDAWKELARL